MQASGIPPSGSFPVSPLAACVQASRSFRQGTGMASPENEPLCCGGSCWKTPIWLKCSPCWFSSKKTGRDNGLAENWTEHSEVRQPDVGEPPRLCTCAEVTRVDTCYLHVSSPQDGGTKWTLGRVTTEFGKACGEADFKMTWSLNEPFSLWANPSATVEAFLA